MYLMFAVATASGSVCFEFYLYFICLCMIRVFLVCVLLYVLMCFMCMDQVPEIKLMMMMMMSYAAYTRFGSSSFISRLFVKKKLGKNCMCYRKMTNFDASTNAKQIDHFCQKYFDKYKKTCSGCFSSYSSLQPN